MRNQIETQKQEYQSMIVHQNLRMSQENMCFALVDHYFTIITVHNNNGISDSH